MEKKNHKLSIENRCIKKLQSEIEDLQNDNTNLKKNANNLALKLESTRADQRQIIFEKENALNQLNNEISLNKNFNENLSKTSRLLNDERNENIESRRV